MRRWDPSPAFFWWLRTCTSSHGALGASPLNSRDLVSKARPGASQSSGRRRGSLDPDECGEYQLRRSAEDLRKAILSPLLPSSQTGRQPDAVIRATLNHSALPGWSALRACARVVRVTVDAHITRTFKNFVYNEHWFQRLGLLLASWGASL